jgi:hypothetical protein
VGGRTLATVLVAATIQGIGQADRIHPIVGQDNHAIPGGRVFLEESVTRSRASEWHLGTNDIPSVLEGLVEAVRP